jgi:chromosomal replication initiator protein
MSMTTSLEHGSLSHPEHTILLHDVLHQLQQRINKEQFDTWFRGFGLARVDGTEAVFSVPNGFLRDWITRNYLDHVKSAVDAVAPRPTLRVSVAVAGTEVAGNDIEEPLDDVPARAENGRCAATPRLAREPVRDSELIAAPVEPVLPVDSCAVDSRSAAKDRSPVGSLRGDCPLNESYTFDEFIVGPCNRLAHATGLAIAANPGRAYNPFFVHGRVGLGKTHLLQAICHAILRSHPSSRVVYLSCEEFTNRFIDNLQNRSLPVFRDYHRSADVLVIEDVYFIS